MPQAPDDVEEALCDVILDGNDEPAEIAHVTHPIEALVWAEMDAVIGVGRSRSGAWYPCRREHESIEPLVEWLTSFDAEVTVETFDCDDPPPTR